MAPTMERTPSEMLSTKPLSVVRPRGRNMAPATHKGHCSADAQAADRVLADSGGEVDALEKSRPYTSCLGIEKKISTRIGTIRS